MSTENTTQQEAISGNTDTTNNELLPVSFDDEANAAEAMREKLTDALTPGFQAEFAPDEAVQAGAFVEDALSEQDAADSDVDLDDATAPA
ncbi:MAG TPA: hypothetical protein VFE81_11570, partial [Paraburkholderia sp.]